MLLEISILSLFFPLLFALEHAASRMHYFRCNGPDCTMKRPSEIRGNTDELFLKLSIFFFFFASDIKERQRKRKPASITRMENGTTVAAMF